MISKNLRAHFILREGYRTKVYKDSLGNLTVGIGHLVLPEDNLTLGSIIPRYRVEELFIKDITPAIKAAEHQADLMKINNNQEFIDALTAVNYQLGVNWTTSWSNTFPALVAGDYDKAIRNLERSKWMKQTPVRVNDFIEALQNLQKPDILVSKTTTKELIMSDSKNILLSKTIVGVILTVSAPFLHKLFGVTINDTLQADVSIVIFNIVEALGAALAVYGRIKATKGVKLV